MTTAVIGEAVHSSVPTQSALLATICHCMRLGLCGKELEGVLSLVQHCDILSCSTIIFSRPLSSLENPDAVLSFYTSNAKL